MEGFVKGSVVVTPFPFSDLKSSIRRPALVVTKIKGDDFILCQITSKKHSSDPYQISLNPEEILDGKLKTKSFIKPSILFTLRKSVILYGIGKISKEKIREVENTICNIITN